MTIRRMFGTCAVTMVAAISGASMWISGADEALAPEPARLGGTPLSGSFGTTWADAKYDNTNTPTKVVMWRSDTYMPANPSFAPAGTPCNGGYLAAYEQTFKVIRYSSSGSHAICR